MHARKTLLKGPAGTRDYAGFWFSDRSAESLWDVLVMYAAVAAAGGSPTRASLAVGLGTMLLIVSSPIGGALADSITLPRMASWTLIARAVIFCLLALVMISSAGWWAVAALVAVMSLVDGAHFPAAASLGRLLVPATGDKNAPTQQVTAARESAGTAARLFGTAAAGILIGWHGSYGAWLAVALALVASAMLRRLTRQFIPQWEPSSSKAPVKPSLGSLKTVWGIVRGDRDHQVRFAIYALGNACTVGPLLLAIPLMSHDYSWPKWGIGAAFFLNAVGALAGAILLNRMKQESVDGRLRLGLRVLLPAVAGMVLVAVGHHPLLVGLGLLISAGCFTANQILMETDLRGVIPDEAQGAMAAFIDIALFGLGPIGQIAFGLLATKTSLQTAGLTFAVLLLLAIALALYLARRAVETKPPHLHRSAR